MESNAMAKNHAWVFARVAFAAIFGGVSAGLIAKGWYDFWYVSSIATAIAALVYGVVYIAYPMVVQQPTAVPAPVIHPDLLLDDNEEYDEDVEERDVPERIATNQRVETVQDSGRFFHLGRTQFQLPEDVKPQHLNIILGARARGRLPDITENKLNKIGISRFAMPPNARTTMEFLRKQGMIDKNGQWTQVGERYFPSPNSYNGQNGVV